MCLTVNKVFDTRKDALKYYRTPNVARRNITVWKSLISVVSDKSGRVIEAKSPHKCFLYERGFCYYQSGHKFTQKTQMIGTGMWELRIFRGLHAYRRRNHPADNTLMKMIIPKGARYFIGVGNDIVADQLIWP